jgi:aminoglycoside phosphotransferase (APT) family kinase protein
MRSRTKLAVDHGTIVKLFEKAGIAGAENIAPLGVGEFTSVYSVDATGNGYAIKIAPKESAKILTYEKQIMAQEVYYYFLMAAQAKISIPEIYYSDFSKTEIPSEFFINERLEGEQIDQAALSDQQREEVEKKLAGMVAKMHAVKGDRFGYLQNGLYDN